MDLARKKKYRQDNRPKKKIQIFRRRKVAKSSSHTNRSLRSASASASTVSQPLTTNSDLSSFRTLFFLLPSANTACLSKALLLFTLPCLGLVLCNFLVANNLVPLDSERANSSRRIIPIVLHASNKAIPSLSSSRTNSTRRVFAHLRPAPNTPIR